MTPTNTSGKKRKLHFTCFKNIDLNIVCLFLFFVCLVGFFGVFFFFCFPKEGRRDENLGIAAVLVKRVREASTRKCDPGRCRVAS